MGLGMLAGMAQALGAGADGYMAGEDRRRRMEQEDEDRKFQKEQRDNMREQQAREKRTRDAIEAAAKDFTVEEVTPQQPVAQMGSGEAGDPALAPPMPTRYRAAGKEFGSREEAQAAAAAGNAPEARMGRVATAMETSGDVVGGLQMRNAAKQSKLGDLQLKGAERNEAVAAFDNELKTALRNGGPEGLADMLTKSKGDTEGGGAQFKVEHSPDGKTWRLSMVGPDGQLIPRTQDFTKDPRGYAEAFVLFSQGVPDAQKLQHYVAQQNADTQAKNGASMAAYHEGQLKIAQQEANTRADAVRLRGEGGGATPAPMWDDKADAFLRERYTIKDPEGKTTVDGHGLQFAKTLAQVMARDKFGGDTTKALGFAFDADQRIAAAAGGDPAKIRALREEALARLTSGGGGGGGAGGETVTRPPTKAEIIAQDMAATGTKDAIVDINGRRMAYGNASMNAAAAAPPAAKAAPAAPAAAQGGGADKATQVAEIKQRLAIDDEIKSSFDGSLGRAMRLRTMPLGMAERRALEQQLQQLTR